MDQQEWSFFSDLFSSREGFFFLQNFYLFSKLPTLCSHNFSDDVNECRDIPFILRPLPSPFTVSKGNW